MEIKEDILDVSESKERSVKFEDEQTKQESLSEESEEKEEKEEEKEKQ
jgi:hypothetical protein